MRQGHLFALFSLCFVIAVTFAFYSLYHVDNLPNKVKELRPRRVSIAELIGQLDDSDLKEDDSKKSQNTKPNVDNSNHNHPPQGVAGPNNVHIKGTNRFINPTRPEDETEFVGVNSVINNNVNNGAHIQHPVLKHNGGSSGKEGGMGSTHNEQIPQQSSTRIGQDTLPVGVGARSESAGVNSGRPRIFCMLFTTVAKWGTNARAVRSTWAQRCDVYRFFYTAHTDREPLPVNEAEALPVPDGRDHLTAKTMTGLRWAYEHFGNQVDWFFKADDDTYVIMENLRFVAAQFKPSEAHYIGGRSTDLIKHGYNSGGAGYLLSKEAARVILQEGRLQPRRCKADGGMEDLDVGVCLETFQIFPIDTRDSAGRLTFHPDHPYKIFAKLGDNARVYTYRLKDKDYGNPRGIRTMSPHTVSFHYVPPEFMYMYDFLLYHLVRHHENGDPGQVAPAYIDSGTQLDGMGRVSSSG